MKHGCGEIFGAICSSCVVSSLLEVMLRGVMNLPNQVFTCIADVSVRTVSYLQTAVNEQCYKSRL